MDEWKDIRTDGDGMEQINNSRSELNKNKQQQKQIKHYIKHFKQIELNKLNLIYLKPKLINNTNTNTNSTKTFSCTSFNTKEARFIPKEPFKGAVTPMVLSLVQNHHKNKHYSIKKHKNNNVDIQVLVSQMSNLASAELKIKDNDGKDNNIDNNDNDKDNNEQKLLQEIKKLKDTQQQLEQQLRFQTQVNSELKTLLVAAVGEDLEARVQLLTQDKLELARALLSSAQNLSSHREQVEYLAGHSEVWRSKFLASSLMVDELAKYKLLLTSHINELQECIKLLLNEHHDFNFILNQLYFIIINIYTKLNINNDNINTTDISDINKLNIIDLINKCLLLTKSIGLHLFNNNYQQLSTTTTTCIQTLAEIKAQQALIKTNIIDDATFNNISNNEQSKTTMIYQLLLNNKIKNQQQQQSSSQSTTTTTTSFNNNNKCIHCNNDIHLLNHQ